MLVHNIEIDIVGGLRVFLACGTGRPSVFGHLAELQ